MCDFCFCSSPFIWKVWAGFVSVKGGVNCEWEQGQEKSWTARCFYKLTLSYSSPVEKKNLRLACRHLFRVAVL